MICQIQIEDFLNNHKLFGCNHWICSVIHLFISAHPHFQQTRIDVNYKLDNYAN